MKLTITAVNQLSKNEFVQYFSQVVEHSPWVAENTYDARPFESLTHLHQKMAQTVLSADESTWKKILNLHPELSGKEAQEGRLTDFSVSEQAGLGLNALSRDEFQKIQQFNKDYRAKFGFPFVVCVRLLKNRAQLFHEMERRLSLTPENELRTGIEQVMEICRLRLEGLVFESMEQV